MHCHSTLSSPGTIQLICDTVYLLRQPVSQNCSDNYYVHVYKSCAVATKASLHIVQELSHSVLYFHTHLYALFYCSVLHVCVPYTLCSSMLPTHTMSFIHQNFVVYMSYNGQCSQYTVSLVCSHQSPDSYCSSCVSPGTVPTSYSCFFGCVYINPMCCIVESLR